MAKYIECEAVKKSISECCGDFTEKDAEYIIENVPENDVVEVPCKVGERVYSIRKDTKVIYECVVCEFIFKKHYDELEKECKVYILEDNRFTYFDFSSFGKTVFLTREEAEQKLKGGKQE